jgi:HK97 family phage prohead protease
VSEQSSRPPRDDTAIRARTDIGFRAASDVEENLGPDYLGLVDIRFSPVNDWTEINSAWEGNFMERFAPGAWKKTIRENTQRIKALFNHGSDPQIGDKVLGPFRTLQEDENGGYAEVKLLDTSYNRDLLPGLKEGLYGASHRFSVVREEVVDAPEPSDDNPKALREHTIKEARLYELGPVTFPAYAGATAGMRSMTDEFLLSCFRSDPDRLRSMFERATDL